MMIVGGSGYSFKLRQYLLTWLNDVTCVRENDGQKSPPKSGRTDQRKKLSLALNLTFRGPISTLEVVAIPSLLYC